LLNDTIKNIRKDIKVEFRNLYAVNLALAFAGISTIAISLVSGGVPFPVNIQSILLWIILFFSAMNGLAHIFIREVEEGTSLFLRLNSSIDAIYISKLIFNIFFFIIIETAVTVLFIFFLQVEIKNTAPFLLTVFSGGLAISSSTTLLGAMVSKAGGRGSLFTVISFPVLLPVMWISISSTTSALSEAHVQNYKNILFSIAFSGIIIILSMLLFKYVWIEE